MKTVALRTLAIATAMALGVVLMEAGLRLFPGLIPLQLLEKFQPELRAPIAKRRNLPTRGNVIFPPRDDGGPPQKFYRYKPHASVTYAFTDPGTARTVTMDAQGFCNPGENPYAEEKIEIIALGDSFTWCTTVNPEATWVSQLSRLLGRSAYNLGIPGTGLYEYILFLRQFGVKKAPHVVVMNVYEGNDLRDALNHEIYKRGGSRAGKTVAPDASLCPIQPEWLCAAYRSLRRGFWGKQSYAFNFVRASAIFLFRPDTVPPVDFRYRIRFSGRSVIFNPENTDQDEVMMAGFLKRGHVALSLFDGPLQEYTSLARAHRFLPVVSYTPSAHTTYAGMVRFEDPAIGPSLTGFSRAQRDYFVLKAREMGFRLVDLTPALQRAAKEEPALLYYPTNLHLTARGHQVAAEVISRFLKDNHTLWNK